MTIGDRRTEPTTAASISPRLKFGALLVVIMATQLSVFLTLGDLGTFVDETWYFRSAYLIEDWVVRVATGETPLFPPDPEVWNYNLEHPPVSKWVYGLADAAFGPGPTTPRFGADYHAEVDEAALRMPIRTGLLGPVVGMRVGALLFLLVAQISVFEIARMAAGWRAGLFAAAAAPTIPAIFGHSHFACIDLPVAALFLATMAVCARFVTSAAPRGRTLLAVGALFGLTVATKLNGSFVALAILPWAAVLSPRRAVSISIAFAAGGVLVLLIVWPYLWTQPWSKLSELARFHIDHRVFPSYFLGKYYVDSSPPWYSVPVLVGVTVPPVLLGLAAMSVALLRERRKILALIVAGALAPVLPLVLGFVPIYDGVRHYLATILLIAVAAGIGFAAITRFIEKRHGLAPLARRGLGLGLAAACLAPGVYAITSVHPYPLAYYNEFVSGPSAGLPPPKGAGLESTVWGAEVVTPDVVQWLNESLPPNSSLNWNCGAYTALREYQRYGMLRSDLRFTAGGRYWVLETNQAYWEDGPFWRLFLRGQNRDYRLVKRFGLEEIDLVRVYERKER